MIESINASKRNKKQLIGYVVSAVVNKTITVIVGRRQKHQLVGKYINRRTKYAVHDEDNAATLNDIVSFEYFRPISKTKNWILKSILRKSAT